MVGFRSGDVAGFVFRGWLAHYSMAAAAVAPTRQLAVFGGG